MAELESRVLDVQLSQLERCFGGAIPAVIAYNNFAGDLNRLATRFDSFMEEFSNILQRQAN